MGINSLGSGIAAVLYDRQALPTPENKMAFEILPPGCDHTTLANAPLRMEAPCPDPSSTVQITRPDTLLVHSNLVVMDNQGSFDVFFCKEPKVESGQWSKKLPPLPLPDSLLLQTRANQTATVEKIKIAVNTVACRVGNNEKLIGELVKSYTTALNGIFYGQLWIDSSPFRTVIPSHNLHIEEQNCPDYNHSNNGGILWLRPSPTVLTDGKKPLPSIALPASSEYPIQFHLSPGTGNSEHEHQIVWVFPIVIELRTQNMIGSMPTLHPTGLTSPAFQAFQAALPTPPVVSPAVQPCIERPVVLHYLNLMKLFTPEVRAKYGVVPLSVDSYSIPFENGPMRLRLVANGDHTPTLPADLHAKILDEIYGHAPRPQLALIYKIVPAVAGSTQWRNLAMMCDFHAK